MKNLWEMLPTPRANSSFLILHSSFNKFFPARNQSASRHKKSCGRKLVRFPPSGVDKENVLMVSFLVSRAFRAGKILDAPVRGGYDGLPLL